MNLQEIKNRARKLYKQGTKLDNKGLRPQRVDRVFKRAISLDPFNLSYHRRYISYLIKHDRINEAMESWACAVDLLKSPDGRDKKSLYKLFHKEIATTLIEKKQYQFAIEVLQSIPETQLRNDIDFKQLVLGLAGIRAA